MTRWRGAVRGRQLAAMPRTRLLATAVLAVAGLGAPRPAPLAAQPAPAPAPAAAPRAAGVPSPIVSPEVHPDRRVTLRLRAPRADTVRVTGEITRGAAQPPLLARDSAGVWSVTLGPLEPDVYTYAFQVDGVPVPDPVNGYVKTGPGGAFATGSQVEVPGDGPQYYDARPVPHGLVSLLQYDSRTLGVPRRAAVYTPPGYETATGAARAPLPVLVLMHGIGETETDWVQTGRANQILDNLIADGRARPMVVVMPLGHARGALGIGPVPNPVAGDSAMRGDPFRYAAIERDLLDDLLPEVERRFRVSRRPEDRAIMGLSLGGSQALRIGLAHPERFAWVAGLSAALVERDPSTGFAALLADSAAANRAYRMIHLTIGRRDWLLPGNEAFAARLRQAGVRHTLAVEEGGHEWRAWRRNLRDLLPRLFRR